MEAQNQRKIWWIWAILAFMAVSFMSTACGKKGGKARVAGGPNGQYSCPNCVGTTNEVASGYGFYNGPIERVQLGLHLYSTENVPAEATTGPVPQYNGSVQVAGYMHVEGSEDPSCPVRDGMYSLRVRSANGNFNRYNAFDISNLEFEAVHTDGTIVRMALGYGEFFDQTGVVGKDNTLYTNGFFGEIRVLSVGNTACGSYFPVNWFFPKSTY